MGADGGINWMRVLNKPRFFELIRCFHLDYDDGYHDGDHDDYMRKWSPVPSDFNDYVVFTYGTNKELHGFSTLREMLAEAESLLELFPDFDDNSTFVDLLLNAITEPEWQLFQRSYLWRTELERALFEGTGLGLYLRYRNHYREVRLCADQLPKMIEIYEKNKDHPVFSMAIKQWAKEVERVIVVRSFGTAETWT